MNDLFRKALVSLKPRENKYKKFALSQNPFPFEPGVKLGNPDPRVNGTIYLRDLRKEEQDKFEKLIVPKGDRSSVNTISFIMDWATKSGRGIGKTAFLHHQKNRIMKDYGKELSGNTEVLFAIHIIPSTEGKSRKFWQFNKLIAKALIKQEIIARALWRLRYFSDVITKDVLAEIGNNPSETIGNDEWLSKQKVDVLFNLPRAVGSKLSELGINEELIDKLKRYGHSSIEFEQKFFDNLSDRYWNNDEGRLIFNDFVKLLSGSGFTKGILLVDNVEEIVVPQNTIEKRAFTNSIRYFFIDGACENSTLSFYSLLFTIHPYVQELLAPHWKASGLNRFSALSGDKADEYTIYFKPLNKEFAIPLAKEYLDYSRLSDDIKGSFEPFEPDSIEEALISSGGVPGEFLKLLHTAIEKAIEKNWEKIKPENIKSIDKSKLSKDELPPAQINMKS